MTNLLTRRYGVIVFAGDVECARPLDDLSILI